MKSPRMRPTFEMEVLHDEETVFAAIHAAAERMDNVVEVQWAGPFADLRVRRADQHFFSPMLHLEFREEEPHIMHGRFSPHPDVWTAFMAIYGLLGIVGIAGAMYGISQWMIGQTPWALLATPIALALIAFVYGAAFIGQGLGAEQMYLLHSVVDHGVESLPSAKSPQN